MTNEQRQQIAKMISDLLGSQLQRMAMLDSPKATDMVYAFENGLTIGKGAAVGAMFGLHLQNANHVFHNGHGERAKHMLRSEALRIEADNVAQTISMLSAQLVN
jgi:hypothetical protein